MKTRLKTPISYYGGKQKLVSTLLQLMPEHRLYTEAFCGGAALFWAKERSPVEVLNDANSEVVNFYRVLKTKYEELYVLIEQTLHSRGDHSDAGVVYQHPHLFTDVQRAWAFWVQTCQGFASLIGKGWAYARAENTSEKKTDNAKDRIRAHYSERLAKVQIENGDALKVIKSRDCVDAFHYCDPPYPESNQGHYSGYNMEHFRSLLDVLAGVKGKFMLSSYPYPLLTEYAKEHGWHQVSIQSLISAHKDRSGPNAKTKTEVITMNYQPA